MRRHLPLQDHRNIRDMAVWKRFGDSHIRDMAARRMRTIIALAVCLPVMLTGCGIGPGSVVVHSRPDELIRGEDSTGPVSLEHPGSIQNAADLVVRFLSAAAEVEDKREATLRTYLEDKKASWRPGKEINVVQIVDGPRAGPRQADGTYPVDVTIRRIGVLSKGRVVPPAGESVTLHFVAKQDTAAGFLLKTPETNELYLPDDSLRTLFESRPLYFRAPNGRLVPDLRYVPKHISEREKADTLVGWLYDPPSPWLAGAVLNPPPATRPTGKVTQKADRGLVVDLAAPLGNTELSQLAEQLMWTLRVPTVPTVPSVQITMQGQPGVVATASPVPIRNALARYAVVNGEVVRLRPSNRENQPLRLPEEANKNVLSVAFSHGEEAVALVRQEGGVRRLHIGPVGSPAAVDLPGNPQPISQPVWLDQRGLMTLVLAGGKVFQVGVDGKAAQVQGLSNVDAMAVAPDGHRLAIVSGGQLSLVALVRGDGGGPISVQATPQPVPTDFTQVHKVAFGARQELVVAGTDGTETRLVVMNLDGTLQSKRDAYSASLRVTHLVADPESGTTLYEIGGVNSFQLLESRPPEALWSSVARNGASPPTAEFVVNAPSFEG